MVDIWMIRFGNKEVEDWCVEFIHENTKDVEYTLHEYDNYKEKLPVSRLWNKFVEESTGEYVCLINSDAYVTEGWLSEMKKCLDDDVEHNIVAVGPSGNLNGSVQGRVPSKSVADNYKGTYEQVNAVSGFCMLIRKTFVMFPNDVPFYYNEIAWQMLTSRQGFKSMWAKGAFVYHINQATVLKESAENWMEYQGRTTFDDFKQRFNSGKPMLEYIRR